MNYLETYCIIGFLFTMFFEFLFETFNDGEFKYSSYGERIIFFSFLAYYFIYSNKRIS